jgi:hypothetical protein
MSSVLGNSRENMDGRIRTLVETEEYRQRLAALGQIKRLDEALRGAMFAIAANAEIFAQDPNFPSIRYAFIRGVQTPHRSWPKLVIRFRITSESDIDLLDIGPAAIEEG